MNYTAGVARRAITPPWGVELAGWGYYLRRTWERVRDDLNATALVLSDESGSSVTLMALDLMYNDERFTRSVREQIAAGTDMPPESVCINFSHSHNAPTAGAILGAGERDAEYLKFAARQAATAAILAWRNRKQVRLYAGCAEVPGISYNRARDNGPVDTRAGVLRVDKTNGQPLAVLVNFHAHPCAHTEEDPRAISRDVPGEVVDLLEAAMPGVIALYLQGTAGDVNFYRGPDSPIDHLAPSRALAGSSLEALALARPVTHPRLKVVTRKISLPTRRWTRKEVMQDREESLYRLLTDDTSGWLDGLAKTVVTQPEKLPMRYGGSVEKAVAAVARFGKEWTDQALGDLESRPELLDTEVQAIRIGDVYFVAHAAELFTSLGLNLRGRWPYEHLFLLGYSNGRIGYLPDEYEISRCSYASFTSPKFTGQFPFRADSGHVLIGALEEALQNTVA